MWQSYHTLESEKFSRPSFQSTEDLMALFIMETKNLHMIALHFHSTFNL